MVAEESQLLGRRLGEGIAYNPQLTIFINVLVALRERCLLLVSPLL